LKFNGVIIAKYLDSSQHFYPTIVLHQIITNDTLRFYLIHEKSQLYEFLEKGDIISKKANLNILTIKRSGAVLSKKIDFGCKDTLAKRSIRFSSANVSDFVELNCGL